MFLLFLFVFGTAIGSFLTLMIDRIPRNLSIIRGRSYCESCKHTLKWLDLLPIISYIALGGKCRYCGKKFGEHYVLLEVLVGILFVLVYLVTAHEYTLLQGVSTPFWALLLYRLFIVCGLFVIFFIDLKHSIIPLSVLMGLGVGAIVWIITFQPSLLLATLLTALCSFLFFFLIHALTRGRGMGFGDVLFAFVMGLLLGFPTIIVGIYIAFLTGSVISLILILGKRKKFKSAIPFGPFLVVGTLSCLLWGPYLTHGFFVFLRII